METMTILDKCFVFFEFFMKNPIIISALFGILLLGLFLLNSKIPQKIKNIFFVTIYMFIVTILYIRYHRYFLDSLDSVITIVLSNLYFPSLGLIFILFIVSILIELYVICSKKLVKIEKIVHTLFFSLYQFFFFSLFFNIEKSQIDLTESLALYDHKSIMSMIELSVFIFMIWMFVWFSIKYYYFLKQRLTDKTNKKNSLKEMEEFKQKLKEEKRAELLKLKEKLEKNKEDEISVFKMQLIEEVKKQCKVIQEHMNDEKREEINRIERELEEETRKEWVRRMKEINLSHEQEFKIYKEKLEIELREELQKEVYKKVGPDSKMANTFASVHLDDIEILDVPLEPDIEILEIGDDV